MNELPSTVCQDIIKMFALRIEVGKQLLDGSRQLYNKNLSAFGYQRGALLTFGINAIG